MATAYWTVKDALHKLDYGMCALRTDVAEITAFLQRMDDEGFAKGKLYRRRDG